MRFVTRAGLLQATMLLAGDLLAAKSVARVRARTTGGFPVILGKRSTYSGGDY